MGGLNMGGMVEVSGLALTFSQKGPQKNSGNRAADIGGTLPRTIYCLDPALFHPRLLPILKVRWKYSIFLRRKAQAGFDHSSSRPTHQIRHHCPLQCCLHLSPLNSAS